MSKIISYLLIIIFAAFLASCQNQVETRPIATSKYFVKGSVDIPLLNDMKQIKSKPISKKVTSNKIIYSSYQTNYNRKQIINFYEESLKKTGWQTVKKRYRYIKMSRDDENLKIKIKKHNSSNLVEFYFY